MQRFTHIQNQCAHTDLINPGYNPSCYSRTQVRQQLYIKQAAERLSPSFPATLLRMVREEGILSLYKGLTVSRVPIPFRQPQKAHDGFDRLQWLAKCLSMSVTRT